MGNKSDLTSKKVVDYATAKARRVGGEAIRSRDGRLPPRPYRRAEKEDRLAVSLDAAPRAA